MIRLTNKEGMKNYIILFTLVVASVFHSVAQNNVATRTTIEQLPYENRTDYIKQATNFLHMYYSQLLLNVDEIMIREEYIKANMSDNTQRYKPEFLLLPNNNINFLTPEQYLQELGKEFREYDTDKIEITVDNVNINQDDFFMPNIVKLYVIAEYDLTLSYEEKILFKRRCRAYCLFPKAMVYINVKLMQVEPVRDIIAYIKPQEINIEQRLANVPVSNVSVVEEKDTPIEFDYIGKYSNTGLAVCRKDGKYGFIDKQNNIVIPIEYDEVGCNYLWQDNKSGNDSIEWNFEILMSVAKNNKWGFINKEGKEIVPCIYDKVDDSSYINDRLTWISKDNKYGCVDTLGNIIIPLKYEYEINFYGDEPARTKLNGKWGFIDKKGEIVVSFIYDDTRGFGWDGNTATVCRNDKYGYVNRKGIEFITLQYEFADDFQHGRAGVVKDGKLGFIDKDGNVVIPFIYEPVYSRDGNGKKLAIGLEFNAFGVAWVKRNGKYAMINYKGDNLTAFKYENVVSSSSWGEFTAMIGNRKVYLDRMGHEYNSWDERSLLSDSIMAIKGDSWAQVEIGEKHYKSKNYQLALKWFNQAYEYKNMNAAYFIAKCYYYGFGINKSYYHAQKYYRESLDSKYYKTEAAYSLGWMAEHGQGENKNIMEAIRYYKLCGNYHDSKVRLEKLIKEYNNGYEYVDLGLSVKWATCNLGASVPEESGDRYAWGEFNTKSTFTKKNCTTYKYKNMMNISGKEYWDAAKSNRKGLWRTPTEEEFNELINKCQWEWSELNGKTGYKVTGPNEESIFIPFNKYSQFISRYWTASSYEKKTAKSLISSWLNSPIITDSERYNGHFIRPVIE